MVPYDIELEPGEVGHALIRAQHVPVDTEKRTARTGAIHARQYLTRVKIEHPQNFGYWCEAIFIDTRVQPRVEYE